MLIKILKMTDVAGQKPAICDITPNHYARALMNQVFDELKITDPKTRELVGESVIFWDETDSRCNSTSLPDETNEYTLTLSRDLLGAEEEDDSGPRKTEILRLFREHLPVMLLSVTTKNDILRVLDSEQLATYHNQISTFVAPGATTRIVEDTTTYEAVIMRTLFVELGLPVEDIRAIVNSYVGDIFRKY